MCWTAAAPGRAATPASRPTTAQTARPARTCARTTTAASGCVPRSQGPHVSRRVQTRPSRCSTAKTAAASLGLAGKASPPRLRRLAAPSGATRRGVCTRHKRCARAWPAREMPVRRCVLTRPATAVGSCLWRSRSGVRLQSCRAQTVSAARRTIFVTVLLQQPTGFVLLHIEYAAARAQVWLAGHACVLVRCLEGLLHGSVLLLPSKQPPSGQPSPNSSFLLSCLSVPACLAAVSTQVLFWTCQSCCQAASRVGR